MDNITSHADNLEKQLCEQVTKAEATSAELKRVEKALQVASKERDVSREVRKIVEKCRNNWKFGIILIFEGTGPREQEIVN